MYIINIKRKLVQSAIKKEHVLSLIQ